MMRLSTLCALVLLGVMTACASAGPLIEERPFSYPTPGAGPGPINGVLLDRGREATQVSSSLVSAIQGMTFTFTSPALIGGRTLAPNELWRTDTLELSDALISRHNAASPFNALAGGRIYGLVFSGEYSLANQQIRYRVKPELFERGQQSPYQPYRGRYFGKFFVDALMAQVDSALLRDSRSRQGR
jgi:hypothetical protein